METLYRFWQDETLLYVGISIDPFKRAARHRTTAVWWDKITHVTFEYFDTREAVDHAETVAIRVEKPVYNMAKTKKSVGGPHASMTQKQIRDWEALRVRLEFLSREYSVNATTVRVPRSIWKKLDVASAAFSHNQSRSLPAWIAVMEDAESALAEFESWWLRALEQPQLYTPRQQSSVSKSQSIRDLRAELAPQGFMILNRIPVKTPSGEVCLLQWIASENKWIVTNTLKPS